MHAETGAADQLFPQPEVAKQLRETRHERHYPDISAGRDVPRAHGVDQCLTLCEVHEVAGDTGNTPACLMIVLQRQSVATSAPFGLSPHMGKRDDRSER